MKIEWSEQAYMAAVQAGREKESARRRWSRQNEWDADNMRTESTRFTIYQDQMLRRCCKEAGVTKYTLINYLLRTWMAAWQAYKE